MIFRKKMPLDLSSKTRIYIDGFEEDHPMHFDDEDEKRRFEHDLEMAKKLQQEEDEYENTVLEKKTQPQAEVLDADEWICSVCTLK